MRKRMTKSKTNRMLTGTIGGISEYFGIDPTIARVIFVFLSMILRGAPVFFYIILAVIIPRADSSRENHYQQSNYERPKQSKKQRKHAEVIEEDNWSDF